MARCQGWRGSWKGFLSLLDLHTPTGTLLLLVMVCLHHMVEAGSQAGGLLLPALLQLLSQRCSSDLVLQAQSVGGPEKLWGSGKSQHTSFRGLSPPGCFGKPFLCPFVCCAVFLQSSADSRVSWHSSAFSRCLDKGCPPSNSFHLQVLTFVFLPMCQRVSTTQMQAV